MIVFVPAGTELFGSLDKSVGHQRRYDRETLIERLQSAGFEMESITYQNRAAKIAWWLNSKILHRQELPLAQSRLFDRLVPLFKALEGNNPSTGLSLIAVGRKAGGASPQLLMESAVAAGAPR